MTTSIIVDNLLFVLPVLALQKLNFNGFVVGESSPVEQPVSWIHNLSVNLSIVCLVLNFVEILMR